VDRITEVEITSEPAGATVYIGDQVGGTTPLAAFLPASTTTIRFELDGHAPTTLRWSPRVGPRVTARLTPTP
jgi:PEGA domain